MIKILCVAAIMGIVAVTALATLHETGVLIEPERPQSKWCYSKTIQAGDAITENNAGVYEYQIYATQKGIEVWTPCQ